MLDFAPSEVGLFMFSISKCRRLLNNPNLSDEEVEQIKNTLYSFAELLVDDYVREHSNTDISVIEDV